MELIIEYIFYGSRFKVEEGLKYNLLSIKYDYFSLFKLTLLAIHN
jgi:hypothetical protein